MPPVVKMQDTVRAKRGGNVTTRRGNASARRQAPTPAEMASQESENLLVAASAPAG